MNSYIFKVTPDPKGSPNNKPLAAPPPAVMPSETPSAEAPIKEEQKLTEPCPPKAPEPCPPKAPEPCPPKAPEPCPPKAPGPCPPVMPEPLYPPIAPIAPPPPFDQPPVFPVFPEYPGQPMFPVQPGYPVYSLRLAHSYTPWQYYNVVFSPREALSKGTMFPELYQPQGVYGPCEGPEPCKAVFPWGGVPYGC